MRLIDADALKESIVTETLEEDMKRNARRFYFPCREIFTAIDNAPTIEERKSTIEFPHVFIVEGYDSIKSEDGETGFGIYDPENKQIFIAGDVPDEIFIKALLHELMHWVQDISGCAFNEGEANTFAENIYNTMESYIVTSRWIPVTERLPEPEAKTYWVCTDTGYQCECRWTNNRFGIGEGEWGWSIFDTPQYSKPIAWMPLPEPYKERREE